MYQTIIDPHSLSEHLENPNWLVVDCRFNLMAHEQGRAEYEDSHISGAVYADLETFLSNPPSTDQGRHPLPAPELIAERFTQLGVTTHTQVVAYDAGPGVMASRLWWMLRYMGHERVAVLDGGLARWRAASYPESSGNQQRDGGDFVGAPRSEWLVTLDQVGEGSFLVDAREPARFRGESEPMDPVAGHIPGAQNRFFGLNLDAEGNFLSADQLREQFAELLDGTAAAEATFYCGSGVTACHNLLALAHAGFEPGKLYVGSWSEWCRDADRPVAVGD